MMGDKKEDEQKIIKDYYRSCIEALSKNKKIAESEFEKKIIYISSGGLGLSIALYPSFTTTYCRWILVCGWLSLIFSIILNLWSQLYNKGKCDEEIANIYSQLKQKPLKLRDVNSELTKTNSIIGKINMTTMYLLLIGILLIIIFTLTNV